MATPAEVTQYAKHVCGVMQIESVDDLTKALESKFSSLSWQGSPSLNYIARVTLNKILFPPKDLSVLKITGG